MIIPGSHCVSPTKGKTVFNKEFTPEKLLTEEFDDEVGRKLEVKRLEVNSIPIVIPLDTTLPGVEQSALKIALQCLELQL